MKCFAALLAILFVGICTKAQPLQAYAGADTAVCPSASPSGYTRPLLGQHATGGVPPYTYTWTIDGVVASYFLDSPYIAQPRVVQSLYNLDSAFFVVEVTDAANAVARDTVRVYFSEWVYSTVTCIQFKAPGDTVSISGQGGSANFGPLHSLQWMPTQSVENPSAYTTRSYTPVTQEYVLYATDRAGCRVSPGSCRVIVSPAQLTDLARRHHTLRIIPLPVTSESRIDISADLLGSELRIFSPDGRHVYSRMLQATSTPLNPDWAAPRGAYFYSLWKDGRRIHGGTFTVQ